MSLQKVFYAVRIGRVPGLYKTWPECESQVKSFPGAEFKKFSNLSEAKQYLNPSKTTSKPKVSSLEGFKLFTDGGSRNNPGIAGCGAILFKDNKKVASSYKYLGNFISNNVAEYQGLILGLIIAQIEGASSVEIFSDSALIVKQIQGKWQVIHPDMIILNEAVQKLLKNFKDVKIKHIERSKNKEADFLSNLAMDLGNQFT